MVHLPMELGAHEGETLPRIPMRIAFTQPAEACVTMMPDSLQ